MLKIIIGSFLFSYLLLEIVVSCGLISVAKKPAYGDTVVTSRETFHNCNILRIDNKGALLQTKEGNYYAVTGHETFKVTPTGRNTWEILPLKTN